MYKLVVLSVIISFAVGFKSTSVQSVEAKNLNQAGLESKEGPIVEEAKEIVRNLFGGKIAQFASNIISDYTE